MELPAGEELKSWAKGSITDEDAHELLHHRFGIFHKLREPAADVLEAQAA